PGQIRQDGHRAVRRGDHRDRRGPLRDVLQRVTAEPEPRERSGAGADAVGPAARARSGQAPRDRSPDPALPRRQGLLRLLTDAAALPRPSAGREGFPEPPRLRMRKPPDVHMVRPLASRWETHPEKLLAGPSLRHSKGREAHLPRALAEPLDHLLVEGNAVGSAASRLLCFRETRIENTLLAPRRRSRPHRP